MKRVIWSVVIVAVVVAGAIWGIGAARRAAREAELERIAAIEDPMERIGAIVQSIQASPSVTSDEIAAAAEGIADAAYEYGEQDALVAVADSLLGLELPPELLIRMRSELHSGIVIQGYYAEEAEQAEYWRRASDLATELLYADGVPADVYMTAAGFHGYAADFAPPEELAETGGHWLPYRLASKGFGGLDEPPSQSDVGLVRRALDQALTVVSTWRSVESAVAAADSILAADQRAPIQTVANASRYWVTADTHPEEAVESARALLAATGPAFCDIQRSVAADLAERELDGALALSLAESALGLAEDSSDSSSAFFAVGVSHRKLGDLEEAAVAFRASIDRDDEADEYDAPQVRALLEVYEASGRDEDAVDLMGRVLARAVMPNEEAHERLALRLEAAGRSRGEIPALLESFRYAGVTEAPGFTLVDRAGNDVALSDLRGRIVLLCFWSYG